MILEMSDFDVTFLISNNDKLITSNIILINPFYTEAERYRILVYKELYR